MGSDLTVSCFQASRCLGSQDTVSKTPHGVLDSGLTVETRGVPESGWQFVTCVPLHAHTPACLHHSCALRALPSARPRPPQPAWLTLPSPPVGSLPR